MRRKMNMVRGTMVLAIVLWFCSSPLVALVVNPLFGRAAALQAALILLPLWLTIGWGILGWYIIKKWFN